MGDRAGPRAPHRPASCAASASIAPCWSGPMPSPRRRSASPSASSWRPKPGFLAFVNQIWPGIWDPALDGIDAMICIIVAFAWKYVGYNFIFFLAALQAIPRSLIEAAAMDGAGLLRRMRDIQLPLLTPTLFFLLVINITDSFTGPLRHRRHHDPGRPGAGHRADGLQDLFRRLQRPRLFGRRRPEHHPDAARHRADRRPVPLSSSGASTTTEAGNGRAHADPQSRHARSSSSSASCVALAPVRDRGHRRDPRSPHRQPRCRCRSRRATTSSTTSPRPGRAPISAPSS